MRFEEWWKGYKKYSPIMTQEEMAEEAWKASYQEGFNDAKDIDRRIKSLKWASGFFLTEYLPDDIMDTDTTSFDEFDIWIEEHISEPFQDMSPAEVWNLICELSNYKLSTERYGL